MSAPQAVPQGSIAPPPAPPAAPSADAVPAAGRSAQDRARSHPEPARDMPEVKGWPLIGSIPDMRRDGMIKVLERAWHEHGDCFRIKLGPQSTVVIAHPDGAERVLASHRETFLKGNAYDTVRQVLGNGLLTSEGRRWKKRRNLAQPSFHRAALVEMVNAMARETEKWLASVKERFPEGGDLEAHREMVNLTLDVVMTALFGPGLGGSGEVSYETLTGCLEIIADRANGVPIPLWIPTPGNLKFKRITGELDDIIYGIIKKARAKKDDPAVKSTLLGMWLDAVDEDTGEPLSDVDIRDELITLFVAGHETTALTMSWLFTLLDGRDDVLERMRAEVAEVLGDRAPTFEDLPKLVYTRQVLDEGLRLRGPLVVVPRTPQTEENLLGYKVHPGEMVLVFFWGLHRHPDFWEDPERFDPDRFAPEKKGEIDRWAYIPFSAGQRVCIGNSFALYEGTLILAMLVQRCTFSLLPGQTIEPEAVGTVRPSAPIHVRLGWR